MTLLKQLWFFFRWDDGLASPNDREVDASSEVQALIFGLVLNTSIKNNSEMAGVTAGLSVLVLNANMGPAECAATLEGLKQASKKISSHKGREFYWNVSSAQIGILLQ